MATSPCLTQAEGWYGTYALGSSYIALPWLCGHAMFSASTITPQEVILTVLYSIAGLGIAIVNDFKSIEGDRELGMNSLPVAFGVDTAKWICVGSIDLTQLGVAAYLYSIGEPFYALILFGLVLPQMCAHLPPQCGSKQTPPTLGKCTATLALQVRPFMDILWTQLAQDPVANDVKYQAAAQPFLVLGILCTAVAIGHHTW
eukprot:scaffold218553_cov35-Tisochrysis_lutea.AAC.1